jgi:hypothetical protein
VPGEFLHHINQGIQPAIAVRLRRSEFPVALGLRLSEFPKEPVGVLGMAGERHTHIHELTDHARVGLDENLRSGHPLIDLLDGGGMAGPLLDDKLHGLLDVHVS